MTRIEAGRTAASEQEVRRARWDWHWSGTAPHLDELVFRRMDAAGAARAFAAGEVSLARGLRPEDVQTLLRQPRLRSAVVEAPRRNTYGRSSGTGRCSGGRHG